MIAFFKDALAVWLPVNESETAAVRSLLISVKSAKGIGRLSATAASFFTSVFFEDNNGGGVKELITFWPKAGFASALNFLKAREALQFNLVT